MKIGELFVSLGIKDSGKTVSTLTNVRKGLNDTASSALQARVALIGALYAFERLMSQSGQAGTNLTNFNALLGVSAQTLQQYQYAARQAGVSNEEVEGTFKSLQGTMTKTLMGEGAPKGLARVAQLTGGMTAQDVKRFAEQPQLLIQKLQEYAAKETNTGLRNEVLKSFGVGDTMIAAMNRRAFTPQQLSKAPTYSDKEVQSLDRANIAWSNLSTKIQMTVGHFNALHGGQLVQDISILTDKALKLANAFMKFSDSAKLFERINQIFEGWGIIFDQLTSAAKVLNDLFSGDFQKQDKASDKVLDSVKETVTNAPGFFAEMIRDTLGLGDKKPTDKVPRSATEKAASASPGLRLVAPPPPPGGDSRAALPPVPAAAPGSTQNQNVNVNQTLNFQHDGADPKRTADSVKKAVRESYRQIGAQGQGS
jgi:hypothetical protein